MFGRAPLPAVTVFVFVLGAAAPCWQHPGTFCGPYPICPLLGFQQHFQIEWKDAGKAIQREKEKEAFHPVPSSILQASNYQVVPSEITLKRLQRALTQVELEFLDPEQGPWQLYEPIVESGNCDLGLFLIKNELRGLICDQTEVFKPFLSSGPEIHEPYVMWKKPRAQKRFM